MKSISKLLKATPSTMSVASSSGPTALSTAYLRDIGGVIVFVSPASVAKLGSQS